MSFASYRVFFFFQAEDGIRDGHVTGVQTCALPISNAGSAGTFITLAAHVAAMAPATNIGAAAPVSMGGGESDSVAQEKIFNFSVSYIQTIAEVRGRNVEGARTAVTEGAASTAEGSWE